MKNTITITAAFERFFSDKYKNYDTFFSAFFRGKGKNDSIPVDRSSKPFQIKVSDIINFLKNESKINNKKTIWMDILDDIAYSTKNIKVLANIVGYHPIYLNEAISIGRVSNKLLDILENNKKVIEEKLKINYLKYEEQFNEC